MRKVIMFNMVTVDGFFEGPNREIDWHNTDEEFNEFAIDQLNTADGLLFGRLTYQMMESYWPTDIALQDDPIVTNKMNSIQKFVFSKTLEKADWNNTTVVNGNIAEEIPKLKQQPGKDLFVFGSAEFASALTKLGFIDEYRLILNPVVLGNGHRLFKAGEDKLNLKLEKAKTFRNGNVLLIYHPVQ